MSAPVTSVGLQPIRRLDGRVEVHGFGPSTEAGNPTRSPIGGAGRELVPPPDRLDRLGREVVPRSGTTSKRAPTSRFGLVIGNPFRTSSLVGNYFTEPVPGGGSSSHAGTTSR